MCIYIVVLISWLVILLASSYSSHGRGGLRIPSHRGFSICPSINQYSIYQRFIFGQYSSDRRLCMASGYSFRTSPSGSSHRPNSVYSHQTQPYSQLKGLENKYRRLNSQELYMDPYGDSAILDDICESYDHMNYFDQCWINRYHQHIIASICMIKNSLDI